MASDIGTENCPWDSNERQKIMRIVTITYHQTNEDVRGDGGGTATMGFLRDDIDRRKGEEPHRS